VDDVRISRLQNLLAGKNSHSRLQVELHTMTDSGQQPESPPVLLNLVGIRIAQDSQHFSLGMIQPARALLESLTGSTFVATKATMIFGALARVEVNAVSLGVPHFAAHAFGPTMRSR
jgi:hypothetical protein